MVNLVQSLRFLESTFFFDITAFWYQNQNPGILDPGINGAGARFGETEAGFCLRFCLSADQIFGSETEVGDPPQEPCGAQFLRRQPQFFFKEIQHTVVKGTKDRKTVLIVPVQKQ